MNENKIEKKPRILIVEDEIENQKYFELILRKKFEVDFCETKKSMYTQLSKNDYVVIIMDISLKDGSNGVDIIRELKQNKSNSNIPIICLSAHAYREEKFRAEEAGAEAYLTKPIKGQLLINTIQEFAVTSLGENK
jgi:DNA-binding response OmpR family regulator